MALGYHHDRYETLLDQLRLLATHEAEPLGDEGFGEKFAITAALISPNGSRYTVRTIWIVRRRESLPRFVTAYPED